MASQGKKRPEQKGESEMARRFRSNPFVFIGTFFILVIVVIAFVFITPAGAIFGEMTGGDLTFGHYDRVPITFVPGNFFAQQYEMRLNQRQREVGQLSWEDEFRVWREAFEFAAVHTAILRTMQRAGYEPPAGVVDREMARLPMFRDENGNFSPALYRQLDENRRLSLWRQVQEDITRSRFHEDIEGLLVPSAEASFVGRMASTERSFEMAVFNVDAFPDSEHEAYARENPELFRMAHLSMITLRGNEREARRVRASIADGEIAFEEAARLHSVDGFADWGGDVGLRMAHELMFDLLLDMQAIDAALALAEGEISDVVRTPEGWVFFRAEADPSDADLSDPLAMGRVRAYMRRVARGRMEDWAVAQAEGFGALAREQGFDAALAASPGVERRSFGPVPINFGNVNLFGSLASAAQGVFELAGSASNEHFWAVAFSTPVGSPSQPVVQGGSVLVLFPVSETEAHASEVDMVASNYAHFWLGGMSGWLLHQHVLNSPRLNDMFVETYFRFFMP